MIQGAGNVMSAYTGCSISSWTYVAKYDSGQEKMLYDDCGAYNKAKNLQGRNVTTETAAALVQPHDTVYVELFKLEHFINYTLPLIQVDFVLISGQLFRFPKKNTTAENSNKTKHWFAQEPPFPQKAFDAIVNNKHVTHWFMTNMAQYAYDPYHPKVRSEKLQRARPVEFIVTNVCSCHGVASSVSIWTALSGKGEDRLCGR